MPGSMQSRVLVVTGGFGALGRALAQMALDEGAVVALVDLAADPSSLPAALAHPSVARFPGTDIGRPEQAVEVLRRVEQQFGRIDALANVAGGFVWEKASEGDVSTWDRLFAQNLRTAASMCRAAVPHLRRAGGGAIVNVGANAAVRAAAGMGAYAASKAGVHRLTEALAEELKAEGIRVNAVLPSILDTAANRAEMPDADFAAWVSPADLARVMLFLCSDLSRAVTGALLPVTGRV